MASPMDGQPVQRSVSMGSTRSDSNKLSPQHRRSPSPRPGTASTGADSAFGAPLPTEGISSFSDLGEIQFAEFEMRIRKFNLDLIQPTIRKMANLELVVTDLRGEVKSRKETLNDLAKTATKVEQQVLVIEAFREEMGRWDMERRQSQAEAAEALATMRQDLDTFRYQLERQDSAINGVQRTLDRVVGEVGRLQENADQLRGHVETRLGQHSRLLNNSKTDLEVKLVALENRHNRLSDDLWGEETGLSKVTRDLKKTDQLVKEMKDELGHMRHDKANVLQLTTVQEEVSNMMNEANSNTTMLKHTVDSMLSDVKEHFRTATNTVAAHNAEMLREVRGSYQEELGHASKLRGEIAAFMEEIQEKVKDVDDIINGNTDQTQEMVQKVWNDVEEVGRQRRRDRNSSEVEVKSIQDRLARVTASSDSVAKWVEHLSSVIWMVVQGERAASALEMQDAEDRGKVALMGYREPKGTSTLDGKTCKAPGSDQGSAKKRNTHSKAHREDSAGPVINVDQRCLSCSGQAQTVLSGFKMACLQYTPGPVTFAKKRYNRSDLLDLRVKLLNQAHDSMEDGPISFDRREFFGDKTGTSTSVNGMKNPSKLENNSEDTLRETSRSESRTSSDSPGTKMPPLTARRQIG